MSTKQRKSERREIDLGVQIETADGKKFRGVLSDISSSGVRLKTNGASRLPEHVLLRLTNELCRWSRIAWRGAGEIGLEFVSFPQASAQPDIRHSVLIKCPKVGKNISTGITLTISADLGKLSSVRRFTQCPYCQAVHSWLPGEAILQAD